MMMLLELILCFAIPVVYSLCNLSITSSTCGDDDIVFNMSISNSCVTPLPIYYSYYTDVNPERHYFNETISCPDDACFYEIHLDFERDAWTYTLTIESPRYSSEKVASIADCGVTTILYSWYIVAGLSILFTAIGIITCSVRFYRTRQQLKQREKKIQSAVIN